jgi:hypothetical protein
MTLTKRHAHEVIDLLVILQDCLDAEMKRGLTMQNAAPNRRDWKAAERLIRKLKKELRP